MRLMPTRIIEITAELNNGTRVEARSEWQLGLNIGVDVVIYVHSLGQYKVGRVLGINYTPTHQRYEKFDVVQVINNKTFFKRMAMEEAHDALQNGDAKRALYLLSSYTTGE